MPHQLTVLLALKVITVLRLDCGRLMVFATLDISALEEPLCLIQPMESQAMFVRLEATVILDRINQRLVLLELSTPIRVPSLKQIVKHVHLDTIVQGLIQVCLQTDSQMKQASVCLVITVTEEQPLPTNISPRKVTTR